MNKIYKRQIINKINKFLNSKEVIVLHGARQVGKTSIMLYIINMLTEKNGKENIFYFDLEIPRYLTMINNGYEELHKYLMATGYKKNKKAFVFIDEIQYLNDPSKFLKLFHDNFGGKIKLIVSGSSSFEIKKKFKNSLVGRTVNFDIWPLDFVEFLLFKNKEYNLRLANLPDAVNEELKSLYKEYVLYGGYPRIVLEKSVAKKESYLNQIINTYVKKDIRDLADIREIDKFNKLIEVLASQTGNLLDATELSNTVDIARQTVEDYLFLLENTYIIKIVKPFYTNKRSELFKTPKIYLIDHGIANLFTFKEFPKIISGNIFETAVFSDIFKNINAQPVHFWRTQAKQEVDFVVGKTRNPIPIEIKTNINSVKIREIKDFMELYKCKNGYIVFLEGKRKTSTKDKIKYLYPWELNAKFT